MSRQRCGTERFHRDPPDKQLVIIIMPQFWLEVIYTHILDLATCTFLYCRFFEV